MLGSFLLIVVLCTGDNCQSYVIDKGLSYEDCVGAKGILVNNGVIGGGQVSCIVEDVE